MSKSGNRGGGARLTLLIDEAYLDRLSEVVSRLKEAGLQIDNVAESIGAVSGTIEESRVASLSSIAGIASVERAREYQLPPPESELQ